MNNNAVTADTNNRRTLDAALVYANGTYNPETNKWEGHERIGATDGGVTLNFEPTIRQREYDGIKGPARGDQVYESFEITAEMQLAELTNATLQKILKAEVIDLGNGTSRIQPRAYINDSDYIETLTLINKLPNGSWVGHSLKNVLVTSGFVLNTEKNGDFTASVVFTAHLDPAKPDEIPYEVITPESMKPTESELQVVEPKEGE